jgi:hypothetical protein
LLVRVVVAALLLDMRLYETGHVALETRLAEIGAAIRGFLARHAD